jgi:hypothetical protein
VVEGKEERKIVAIDGTPKQVVATGATREPRKIKKKKIKFFDIFH